MHSGSAFEIILRAREVGNGLDSSVDNNYQNFHLLIFDSNVALLATSHALRIVLITTAWKYDLAKARSIQQRGPSLSKQRHGLQQRSKFYGEGQLGRCNIRVGSRIARYEIVVVSSGRVTSLYSNILASSNRPKIKNSTTPINPAKKTTTCKSQSHPQHGFCKEVKDWQGH